VDGDPTSEIAATRSIAKIWLGGIQVDRHKLLEKVKVLELAEAKK